MIRKNPLSIIMLLLLSSASHSMSVANENSVNERIYDYTISSELLTKETNVRIMLPVGYDSSNRSYPVIYLLHGGGGGHEDWTLWGAEEIVGDSQVIVVQPSMGKGSWYADATVPGLDGRPQWESFFFKELVPWIDSNFKTKPERQGRAIVGLSMGGYGAMSYAARHPDKFIAASSFSGAVNTRGELVSNWIGVSPVIDIRAPYSIFGLWPLDTKNRRAHNPWDLAHNLSGMHLSFYFGNGKKGVLDDQNDYNPVNLFMNWIQEAEVHRMNNEIHAKLNSLGIAHDFKPYGDGMHTAGYWIRSLREELPILLAVFDNPPAATNRLVNGDFELSGKHQQLGSHHWQCHGQCGVDRNIDLQHDGQGNGWVRNNNKKWNEIYQDVAVAQHTDYYINAWLRASESELTQFGVKGVDGSSISDTTVVSGSDYQPYLIKFNSGKHRTIRVFAGLQPAGRDAWLQLDSVFLAAGQPANDDTSANEDGTDEDLDEGSDLNNENNDSGTTGDGSEGNSAENAPTSAAGGTGSMNSFFICLLVVLGVLRRCTTLVVRRSMV